MTGPGRRRPAGGARDHAAGQAGCTGQGCVGAGGDGRRGGVRGRQRRRFADGHIRLDGQRRRGDGGRLEARLGRREEYGAGDRCLAGAGQDRGDRRDCGRNAAWPRSPTSGGSYEVTQPGPLNGFKLDVPAAALTVPLQLSVTYSSSAGIPRVGPVNPVSPIISIGGAPSEYAVYPFTIHIQAEIPATAFPVIAMYDPASGKLVPFTTIAYDAHGVTAITATLNPASLIPPAGLRAPGPAAAQAPTSSGVVVIAVPAGYGAQDYDSGFLPGRDDWEFHALVAAIDHCSDISVGMAETEPGTISTNPRRAPCGISFRMPRVSSTAIGAGSDGRPLLSRRQTPPPAAFHRRGDHERFCRRGIIRWL